MTWQTFEMETALAERQAKLKVLKEYKRSEDGLSNCASVRKLLSENVKNERVSITLLTQDNVNVHVPARVQHSRIPQQPQPVSHQSFRTHTNRSDDILTITQKQNVITELLVKQQQLSQFKGDALQYKSFMRAFKHAIGQKTDSDQDKLYFLEQFTDF